ncbi:MAG TPA: hypothetical protein PJ982_10535 [Lacipirellulaceae bacterium]|nr:hypothetical protein [Lacipirellulaceae bacterium]
MKMIPMTAAALMTACLAGLAPGAPVLRFTFDEASGDVLDAGAAPAANATFVGGVRPIRPAAAACRSICGRTVPTPTSSVQMQRS